MKLAALVLALFLLILPVSAFAAEVQTDPSDPTVSTGDLSLFAVSSGDLKDLAYLDLDCSLGEIRIYLPEGYSSSALQLSNGLLINTTNSTIYPYCPDFPSYVFQASRWSSLTYRPNATGYNWTDINDVVITDVFDPSGSFSSIYIFLLLSILFALLVRRSFPS